MTPRKRNGQTIQHETPEWDPLLKLLAEYLVADFIWMHEVELKDGTRLHLQEQRNQVEITLALMEQVLGPDRLRPCHEWAASDPL